MPFELTKTYIEELRSAIKEADEDWVVREAAELHSADIAEIFDELSLSESQFVFRLLDKEKSSDVVVALEEDVRDKFLEDLTSQEIAEQVIDHLESDDAADMIGELSDEKQTEVISLLEDIEQASDIVDLLNYDEGTAGALMGKELIAVREDWSVLTCAKEMRRQGEDMDFVYAVYVVDQKDKLIGTLSLKKLLITPAQVQIRDIYKPKVISVQTSAPQEEVANIMEKYDLVALPVVDQLGRLMGRITIDDVVDVIKEEAERDYQLASGISQDVESTDSVWLLSRARIPWLLIGLAGGIFGARVIGLYEEDIQIHPEMAYFIPLIAAMGGNVGVQSSAIIVQGLANNSLGLEGMFSKLSKEFGVALINGLVCSVIILAYNLFFSDSLSLTLTVSSALLSVIIVAGLFGTFVPLVLHRYKIDPALATGPFITTMNDILGLFIYFWIGRMMYLAF